MSQNAPKREFPNGQPRPQASLQEILPQLRAIDLRCKAGQITEAERKRLQNLLVPGLHKDIEDDQQVQAPKKADEWIGLDE